MTGAPTCSTRRSWDRRSSGWPLQRQPKSTTSGSSPAPSTTGLRRGGRASPSLAIVRTRSRGRGSCVGSDMTDFTTAQIEYLASQRLGRIATAGADGKPHVAPTSFRYNSDLGTIDVGGLHVATTKKYRDVQANPWAAIVIDDLASIDPWTPRMLEIRGRAEAVPSGGSDLSRGFGDAFIRLYPDKVNSFGID